jgi:hypothetical protein
MKQFQRGKVSEYRCWQTADNNHVNPIKWQKYTHQIPWAISLNPMSFFTRINYLTLRWVSSYYRQAKYYSTWLSVYQSEIRVNRRLISAISRFHTISINETLSCRVEEFSAQKSSRNWIIDRLMRHIVDVTTTRVAANACAKTFSHSLLPSAKKHFCLGLCNVCLINACNVKNERFSLIKNVMSQEDTTSEEVRKKN